MGAVCDPEAWGGGPNDARNLELGSGLPSPGSGAEAYWGMTN